MCCVTVTTSKESGDFIWLGLELGCVVVFDFALARAQVRSIVLIEELAREEAVKVPQHDI